MATYTGTPFKLPQSIPGRLLFAYFDKGGEGVAFHNRDTVNHGSGELNKGPGEKNHFREHDGISTSYTKPAFDRFAAGALLPPDQHYVGWTFPGQWLNYTVFVKAAGAYVLSAVVSSHHPDAAISFAVDGVDATGPIAIPSTGDWHTWEHLDSCAAMTLPAGLHVITAHVVRDGNMNLLYVDFAPGRA